MGKKKKAKGGWSRRVTQGGPERKVNLVDRLVLKRGRSLLEWKSTR